MSVPVKILMTIKGDVVTKGYPYESSMSGGTPNSKTLYIALNTPMATAYLLSAADIKKADAKRGDIASILGKPAVVERSNDYAEAKGTVFAENYDDAVAKGVIEKNVTFLFDQLFADKKNLFISPDMYTIYDSSLVSWERKGQSKPEIIMNVSFSLAKGDKIGFIQKNRLSCKGKRENLRASLESVLGIKMKKAKPTGKVARRLVPPKPKTRRGRRYLPQYNYNYGFPGYNPYGPPRIAYDSQGRPYLPSPSSETDSANSRSDRRRLSDGSERPAMRRRRLVGGSGSRRRTMKKHMKQAK